MIHQQYPKIAFAQVHMAEIEMFEVATQNKPKSTVAEVEFASLLSSPLNKIQMQHFDLPMNFNS